MRFRRLMVLGALVAHAAVAGAQSMPVVPEPGSDLTITLITFGQDIEVFERFGHNAIWIHNSTTGQDLAYHWGLFSFQDPHFIARFLTGDTRYWMGASPGTAIDLIEFWRRRGRPVTLQRLNLTPAQALKLQDFLLWNAREENKFYRYDYFGDNCSTRLRDALDMVVGGAIKRTSESVVTDITYRRESVRLVDGDKPIQLGIDIALGRPADIPLTAWQSYFIPMRLRDGIRGVKIEGANGALVPLVANEREVELPSNVVPIVELTQAPRLFFKYASLGLVLASLVVGLGILMREYRAAAWVLAIFGSLWSLVCGLIGVILLLAWFVFTKHFAWARNENVLLLTPLSLVLVALIPLSILRRRGVNAAAKLSAVVATCAAVALIMAMIPGGAENRAVAILFAPVHAALAWVLWSHPRTRE